MNWVSLMLAMFSGIAVAVCVILVGCSLWLARE